MPTFEIVGPDGGTYHIDADNEEAALSAFHPEAKTIASSPAAFTADMLRKFKQGAALGFGDEASAALKATFGGRGAQGATWGDRYQGARDYERSAYDKATANTGIFGAGAELLGSIAPSIGAGELVGAAGAARSAAPIARNLLPAAEGAGAALPALPGAIPTAARTAANPLANAMGTGALVGSVQSVGDTEDKMDAPLAAVKGAVVGSLGGAAGYGAGRGLEKLSGFTNTAARVKDAPTTDQLRKAAQSKYAEFENAGGLYTQEGLNALSDALDARLATWQPELAPGVHGLRRAMDRLRVGNAAPGAAPLLNTATPTGLQNLRMVAEGVRDTANNKYQSRLGRGLVEEIDNFIANPQAEHYIGSQSGLKSLSEANKLWQQFSKAEAVDKAFEKALNRAGSTYSGGNENNAVRQNLRSYWEKRGQGGFTPDENAAFKTAVRGGTAENVARGVGKLAASRGGLSAMAQLAAMLHSPHVAIPLEMTAEGAKYLGDRLTRRNLEEVSRVIRSGGTRRAAAVAPNAIQRGAAYLPQLLSGPGGAVAVRGLLD